MKILMISSYLPYPLHSGGQIRLYNLIKELSEKHEITLICEKRKYQTKDDVKNLEKICKKVITVERQKQWSINNIAKTTITSHSFLVTGHTHLEMQKKINEELLNEKFDLIHVETFYVLQNLPVTSLPIVLAEHNIEYQVYQKFVNNAPFIMRPILSLDILKIKREEEAAWKQVKKVVSVSEEDKKIMKEVGVDSDIVPNGVNIDEFMFKSKIKNQKLKILFIGDFKWIQNQDSIKFIIEEIWPEIKSKIKNQKSKIDLKLWVVGRTIPDGVKNLTSDLDVIFDEESSVKSAPEIFQEADILLAPIRVGGGTSYKILESLSSGTPVVTMPMSATAIQAKDNQHLMVGENAKKLAEKTIALLEDEKLYKKIATQGRELIEEKYSWKNISKSLEQVYKNVILNA